MRTIPFLIERNDSIRAPKAVRAGRGKNFEEAAADCRLG